MTSAPPSQIVSTSASELLVCSGPGADSHLLHPLRLSTSSRYTIIRRMHPIHKTFIIIISSEWSISFARQFPSTSFLWPPSSSSSSRGGATFRISLSHPLQKRLIMMVVGSELNVISRRRNYSTLGDLFLLPIPLLPTLITTR